MKLGIIGYGVVGSTLGRWLVGNTKHDVQILDPALGKNDDFTGVQAIFICVPADTKEDRTQDLSIIKESIEKFRSLNVPYLIRTTVLPGTCDDLAKEFNNATVFAMPEFLTERRSKEDFESQSVIYGYQEKNAKALKWAKEKIPQIFPGKHIVCVTNRTAELGKYAHNAFGALKVNFMNNMAELADSLDIKWPDLLKVLLMTGYVGREHTKVPGPDRKPGYGGKCLPKDLAALILLCEQCKIPFGSLYETERENFDRRSESDADLKQYD